MQFCGSAARAALLPMKIAGHNNNTAKERICYLFVALNNRRRIAEDMVGVADRWAISPLIFTLKGALCRNGLQWL